MSYRKESDIYQKSFNREPRNGTFELTIRCNLKCKMCLFRHDDSENPKLISEELSAEEWIDIAKQISEAGTIGLLITGGEPLIRPDFCKIWEEIYKLGFVITLYTNATLVNERVMEVLRKYAPHKIGVTIYGASPKTYEEVCGNGMAFEKMIEGVKLLRTLPSVFEFRTTIVSGNFEDSKLIDQLVEREFGWDGGVKQACPINKAVRGACADVESYRVSPELDVMMKRERLLEVMRKYIGETFDEKKIQIEYQNDCLVKDDEYKSRYSLFGCQAGISQYTVTYNGLLVACQMIDVFSINLKENCFAKAWCEFPTKVRIPKTEQKCTECDYKESCQACYASRYAETGDFNRCSEYIYRFAKAKKEIGC